MTEPFGNGLVRVDSQELFPPHFASLGARRFIDLTDLFPPASTNCPWVSENGIDHKHLKWLRNLVIGESFSSLCNIRGEIGFEKLQLLCGKSANELKHSL